MNSLPLKSPESPEHSPVWLAQAVEWARARGATDIHLFPAESNAEMWVRVDGELITAAMYPLAVHTRMVARLKVLGRCSDYAGELVQEGRFSLNGHAAAGEARLSILPTLRGEKAVIRLMAGHARLSMLDELGFPADLAAALRAAMDRPQGMILACGPSGCGKSTALYALLADLHARAARPLSILTIEDPVEQSLPFAAQIGADPARGLGFADGLRAILRQDPEVVMIGEIRDAETSTAALQAALSGHRLVSTMHALTPAEALVRLRQMGSPPYVISSALAGVLNLRLVRLLCDACKRARPMTPAELELVPAPREWPERTICEPPPASNACEACLGSGHKGRTAVGEWVVPTPATALALQENAPADALARTLQHAVSARQAWEGLLRGGRASLHEIRNLAGVGSVESAGRTGNAGGFE